MHIHFVDKLPEGKSGAYAHYHHRKFASPGWTYCDLRSYIYERQEKWIQDLDKWHATVCRAYADQTRFWWFFPSSRLIAFQPPIFKAFFFAIALTRYGQEKGLQEIYVLKAPAALKVYLQELMPSCSIDGCDFLAQDGYFSLKGRLINKAREIVRILKAFTFLLVHFLKRERHPKIPQDIRLVVYSHVLNARFLDEKGEHYFGKSFHDVPGLKRDQILWYYFPEKKGLDAAYRDYYRTQGFQFALIYDFLTWADMGNIFKQAFKVRARVNAVKDLPALEIDGFKSSRFLDVFHREAIQILVPVSEFAVYYGLKRFFQRSHPKAVIYPYEEKGFERALLFACRESSAPVRTFSFAHSFYNKGLTYVRYRKDGLLNSPKPDKILMPGPLMRKWFVEWAGVPSQKTDILGSSRYHDNRLKSNSLEAGQRPLRVLSLMGLSHEAGMLANYVEEEPSLFDGCDLLIRPYPYSWQGEQEDGASRIARIMPRVQMNSKNILEQLDWCDVALCSSTSAGIEAMLCGRLIINLNLHDELNLNPLSGKVPLPEMNYCSNPAELKAMLKKIKALSDQDYAAAATRQRQLAAQIFSPIDKDAVLKMVM